MPSDRRVDVGDEQIVADELAFVADEIGQRLPALPIVLGHAVLDRRDGISGDELREVFGLLLRAQRFGRCLHRHRRRS